MAFPKNWQEIAAQMPSIITLDSRRVYGPLARNESSYLGHKVRVLSVLGFLKL